MDRISKLLNDILRNSFLSEREKAEWFEEMYGVAGELQVRRLAVPEGWDTLA